MNHFLRIAIALLLATYFASPALAQSQTPTPLPDFLIDLNQDGTINAKDLLILLHRWGVQGIATPTPSPTETPTNPNVLVVDLPPLPSPLPMRLVRIPAGSFMMGSPATERGRSAIEGPVHLVTIGYDFFMGETEVTRSQWLAVMGSLPRLYFSGVNLNDPIYYVSWYDCQEFIAALNALGGEGTFRLPSEAEWEYACRAGTTSRFYFGNSLGCADECQDCDADEMVIGLKGIDSQTPAVGGPTEESKIFPAINKRSDFMWYCANSQMASRIVRLRLRNNFGLYDMLGNVSEWVQDDGHADYVGAPTDGSAWESTGGGLRMARGGTYLRPASASRSASRSAEDPNLPQPWIGFRVVWTP